MLLLWARWAWWWSAPSLCRAPEGLRRCRRQRPSRCCRGGPVGGRAVLMRGGTVGDGRGGPGSGRIPVGGRAAGLSWLPGCAAPVGVGTPARRSRDRCCAASAAGALCRLSGHACVAAGDAAAATGVCGRRGRRGVVGACRRARAPLGWSGARCSRGDGAGLVAGDGRAAGSDPHASVAGGPPRRRGHHGAGGARLPVA